MSLGQDLKSFLYTSALKNKSKSSLSLGIRFASSPSIVLRFKSTNALRDFITKIAKFNHILVPNFFGIGPPSSNCN